MKELDNKQLDDIITAIDSVPDFEVTKDISDFAKEKVLRVLELQGFKRHDSARAQEFMKNKTLMYELDKGQFLVIYVVYEPHMNAMYRMLVPVKTKSGIIYVENTKDNHSGFMSHFFDRFAQRTGECTIIQRKKAIRRYLQTDEFDSEWRIVAGREIDENKKSLITIHKNGVCLGINYKGHEIYKTFISYGMASRSQLNIIDNIKKVNVIQKRYIALKEQKSKGPLSVSEKEQWDNLSELLKNNSPTSEDLMAFDVE